MTGINSDTKLMLHFNDEYNLVRPYAHYKCNDDAANTTVVDSGSGANNGVVHAVNTNTMSEPGKINESFNISGSTTKVVKLAALIADIKTDTTGSICFWFNGYDYYYMGGFNNASSGDGNKNLTMRYITPGTLQISLYSDVNIMSLTTTTTFSTNAWHHVAFVQDGVEAKIYVNGSLSPCVTSGTMSYWLSTLNAAATLAEGYIGCRPNYSAPSTAGFYGNFDDWRYYQNHALTADAVKRIYNEGNGTEGSGIEDSSPASTHSTSMFGTAALVTGSSTKFGTGALVLDGNSDYLSIPDSADWDIAGTSTGEHTVDLQFYYSSTPAESAYLISQYENANNLWATFINTSDKISLFYKQNNDFLYNAESQVSVPQNQWNHLAYIVNGDKVGLYLNGTQVCYAYLQVPDTFAGDLYIGDRGSGDRYFTGNLDEIRIQNSNYFNATPNSYCYTPIMLYGEGSQGDTSDINYGYGGTPTFSNIVLSSASTILNSVTSYSFAVSTSSITIPESVNNEYKDMATDAAVWTFDGWFYYTGDFTTAASGRLIFISDGTGSIAANIRGAGANYHYIRTTANNGTDFFWNDNGTQDDILVNTYYHFAIVKTATALGVYLNGVQKNYSALTSAYAFTFSTSTIWVIGNNAGDDFEGYMENIQFSRYNKFGAAPVVGLTNTIVTPSTIALVTYSTIKVPTSEYSASNLKRSQVVIIG